MKVVRNLVCLILFVCFSVSSAYSVLSAGHPIGEIFQPVVGQSRGMGGVSVAIEDKNNLSLVNPANLSTLHMAVFSVLSSQGLVSIKDENKSASLFDSDIPLVIFAFPLSRIGSIHAAYRQISKLNYNFSPAIVQVPGTMDSMSQVIRGGGSRYAGQIGFSRSWTPWLHTGIAYQRSMGFMKLTRLMDYKSNSDIMYADEYDTTALHTQGDNVSLGITLNYKAVSLGLSGKYSVSNTARQTKTTAIRPNTGAMLATSTDSIGLENIPLSYAAGLGIKASYRLLLGLDIATNLWEKYNSSFYSKKLENDLFVALGAEWVYNRNSEFSWIERVPVRAGAFYKKWPNDNIKEAGCTVGVGLPTGNKSGNFDIAVEYARRGNMDNVGLVENSYKLYIGFTGNGKWGRRAEKR